MAAGGIVADQATTIAMVNAFNSAQAECRSIAAAVESARGQLGMQWQSDAAAPRFLQAVDQWMTGFQRVRQGLDLLNENMQSYSNLTSSTEDANTSHAGGWATP
ncbi:WXG100 family type VII secretion target [Micromonospora rubida]